jgi:hypothetical protein
MGFEKTNAEIPTFKNWFATLNFYLAWAFEKVSH